MKQGKRKFVERLAASHLTLAGLAVLVSSVLPATRAVGQMANQITAVSPVSAAQGTSGLTVTFTLDSDAPPPPATPTVMER